MMIVVTICQFVGTILLVLSAVGYSEGWLMRSVFDWFFGIGLFLLVGIMGLCKFAATTVALIRKVESERRI